MQSPGARGRGIGRYALSFACALEQARPDLVGRYLLDPDLPPPGAAEELLATGKVAYADTPGALLGDARVFHALWPLDLDRPLRRLWPAAARAGGLRLSASVYDLIPALDPARELISPVQRRRYRARLEILRAADRLLVLSGATGRDCAALLGRGPASVVRVGAAPDASFAPAASAVEAAADEELLGRVIPGLAPRYVLYPSGSHPRKNNEALVTAFAALPGALREGVQLVISGELDAPTVHHYEHLASSNGAPGCIVAPGHVGEATLLALYRRAALVCVPSLAEGYGLPVAEALACGAPVIASDRPPFDELLPVELRFDPREPGAITAALARALAAPASATAPATAPERWGDVALGAAAAFDDLLARSLRGARRPRRHERLALVSPLPPAETGVGAYSYRLIEALVATGEVDVRAFADGPPDRPGGASPVSPGTAPAGVPVHRARALSKVESYLGGFDHVIYAFGNSHHHLGALSMLARRPGVVIAHDVRLTNLYRHHHGDPGLAPGGLGRDIRRLYGTGLPPGLGDGGDLGAEDLERYGILMAKQVIGESERFLVSSEAARALALCDAGPRLASRIGVLPFACALPRATASSYGPEAPGARGSGPAGIPTAAPVVAHFGIVDPAKEPETLLRAVAALRATSPEIRLAFVGPVADALAERLRSLAGEVGLGDRLVLCGAVPAATYLEWLRRADVAVQLRASFNGEASAAVGECLAAGVPTVATRIGWLRELPEAALVRVERACHASTLAAALAGLLADTPRRSALRAAALDAASTRTFEASAAALLEHLRGLGDRRTAPD